MFTGQDKAVVVPGDCGLSRERLGTVKVLTHRKKKDRERETERMRAGESGEREREHFLEVHSSSLQSSMAFSP